MNAIYYIGLDIHKKTIAYCIKRIDGMIVQQGTVAAKRPCDRLHILGIIDTGAS